MADGEGARLWATATDDDSLGEIRFTIGGREKQKAREVGAPAGVKPVEWRLLTNRAASTLEQVTELIDWYRARWEIEVYFNILKNGCEVEELQLATIDRLERALALFMVVAWRVAYLMRKGHTCPELDAALFFDPDEIRGAHLLNKLKMPATPPSLSILR